MLNVVHLDERIEKCLSILADNPYSQVFAALAEAYRKRGDFGRAFSVCKGGLKHHPNYAPAHLVLAKLYLHQGMLADALASLERAIEIDGATRSTDFVEAEIRLAIGEADAARVVIDRLRATDRHDPVVKELCERLKALKKSAAETPTPPSGARLVAPPLQRTPSSDAESSIGWPEWGNSVQGRPLVERAFVFVLPCHADDAVRMEIEAPPSSPSIPIAPICAALFGALDAILTRAGIGALEEIRIERRDGELWCRRRNDHVIGFTGRAGLLFGAVRQTALDAAERVSAFTAERMSTSRQG